MSTVKQRKEKRDLPKMNGNRPNHRGLVQGEAELRHCWGQFTCTQRCYSLREFYALLADLGPQQGAVAPREPATTHRHHPLPPPTATALQQTDHCLSSLATWARRNRAPSLPRVICVCSQTCSDPFCLLTELYHYIYYFLNRPEKELFLRKRSLIP